MELKEYLATRAAEVDAALDAFLPKAKEKPATIHAAMRYSLFAGGKRLRPILCLAAAEACGGDIESAMPPACAVEILHTYSLVHDDLPCMDDDDLRRGRPTCHKVYGEGMAVLTGDALLTEAFLILAQTSPAKRYPTASYVAELALTGGSTKLIGGQVMDLEGEGKKLSKAQLVKIHEAKTAALLATSIRLGAMTANATDRQLEALSIFGRALGLAFQVIDDILDVTASTEVLGKTAGKDLAVEKATYPAVLGLEKSRKEAAKLTEEAMAALQPFGKKAQRLREIAEYLLKREY
ncbi:MAG: polyprenyl synthetase family protein [Verrucomicrobia bacterium]|nr:MAG: polyprenyl synthetase family protein [Verrucomicrobiota bacterium]TAE85802.1 MAG: polyprenyl synthetase family protein [Verrucomicrobiota bacterium]TAF23223.1 MAG: polyprenyl synthetase family protein [Verrucomicrobiota bacterium]TAF40052.1 MAG: polyprenyl synthetase family protein [Verrucomicrobiota bacterium]